MKSNLNVLAGGLAIALATAGSVGVAAAQEPAKTPKPLAETVDLSKLTCRTLLKMSDGDRTDAFLFLHGYVSGTKKEMTLKLDPMAEATDEILDECIDHPAETALAAFTKYR